MNEAYKSILEMLALNYAYTQNNDLRSIIDRACLDLINSHHLKEDSFDYFEYYTSLKKIWLEYRRFVK